MNQIIKKALTAVDESRARMNSYSSTQRQELERNARAAIASGKRSK